MNLRAQLVCGWIGVAATVSMFAAMWPLMHFLPPLDPMLTTAETAAIYRTNGTGIIVGGFILLGAASAVMPFYSALAMQLMRMENPSRLWTYTLLTSSVLGFLPLLIAEMLFSTAAFRPGRPDEIIQALNDFGFIMFVGPSLPGTVQILATAIPVLTDRNPEPIFPRWVGYANIWAAIAATPGCLVTLFKSGPFAWNGAISFWVAASAFSFWMFVNFWAMRRALLRQMRAA
jgi:hypothetical protein